MPGFDKAYYLHWYPDVRIAGIDPLAHYLTCGWLEGRDPSAGFSTERYLAANPDVREQRINPLLHFVECGLAEGRTGWQKAPGPPPGARVPPTGPAAAADPETDPSGLAKRTVRLCGRERELWGAPGDPYFAAMGDLGETQFASILRRCCPPDGIVIDIGANVGVTALVSADVLPAGHVYAIEASRINYDLLCRNIRSNRVENVSAFNFAAGSDARLVEFVQHSAWGHVATGDPEIGGQVTSVPMRTIDEFVLAEGMRRLDFVKIDVEGFERPVLEGMARSIREFDPVFYIEFNSWTLLAFGKVSPFDFLEYLLSKFARVYALDGSDLRRVTTNDLLEVVHRNLIEHGCVDDLVVCNRDL